MKIIDIKQFERFDYYESLTIEDLKLRLGALRIQNIYLDNYTIRIKDDNTKVRIMTTDKDHPFTLENGNLYINCEWFEENKDIALEIVNYIALNIEALELLIGSKELITDDLIMSLARNPHLKSIGLTPYSPDYYLLEKGHYEILKAASKEKIQTRGVSKELETNFDPIIIYNQRRPLINNFSYHELQNEKYITITRDLKMEDIPNLKYLNNNTQIRIEQNALSNLPFLIAELKKNNMTNEIIIKVTDKEEFNKYIMQTNLHYPNIMISYNLEEVKLETYLRLEKRLYDMVHEARHLSPFEKYIVAYNLAKKFKPYKENKENKDEARNLYQILENDYMVCVGFSNLFADLLQKLGLLSADLSISVDTSYDLADKGLEEVSGIEKETLKGYHARRLVRIVDPKYGIDGIYFADPTWDNDMMGDYYNHLALTSDEVLNARRLVWLFPSSNDELLLANSIEEFYAKLNFLLDRNLSNSNDNIFASSDSENLKFILSCFIKEKLRNIAPDFIQVIEAKYPFLKQSITNWPSDLTDLIYDIAEFVVNNVNNKISGETIFKAISEVYQQFYHYNESDLTELLPRLIEENRAREELNFPKRSKVYDDHSEVIMNEENKFAFDDNLKYN